MKAARRWPSAVRLADLQRVNRVCQGGAPSRARRRLALVLSRRIEQVRRNVAGRTAAVAFRKAEPITTGEAGAGSAQARPARNSDRRPLGGPAGGGQGP